MRAGRALTKDHVLVANHARGAAGILIVSRATLAEVAFVPTKGSPPWAPVALDP
ncbi:Hypothetical protein A7982_00168 [Minicystis rosea]|nr:Hypothetical protein A7982_00168 [Minicystis rosea]